MTEPVWLQRLRQVAHEAYNDGILPASIHGKMFALIPHDLGTELLKEALTRPAPVPLILHCPECTERHIDKGEFADRAHHTHACQHCGLTWRPAVVDTVGVQFLPGFKDPS